MHYNNLYCISKSTPTSQRRGLTSTKTNMLDKVAFDKCRTEHSDVRLGLFLMIFIYTQDARAVCAGMCYFSIELILEARPEKIVYRNKSRSDVRHICGEQKGATGYEKRYWLFQLCKHLPDSV